MANYISLGIDENTGYEMRVGTDHVMRYVLPVCPSCGSENVLSGNQKIDDNLLCIECSKELHNFKVMMTRLKHSGAASSEKSVRTFLEKIERWIAIRDRGGLAPDGLNELKMNAKRFLAPFEQKRRDALASQELEEVKCHYCGHTAIVPVGTAAKDRLCDVCAERRRRYDSMSKRVGMLSLKECYELMAVLDEYALQRERGYPVPHINSCRAKVQARYNKLLQLVDK